MIQLKPRNLDPRSEELRGQVRAFIRNELASGGFVPQCDCWTKGFSRDFSRKLASHGWIGMTWPKEYGGHERSSIDRFIVIEELLAAGAPVASHWLADRQIGPSLLRHGTEEQKRLMLPGIARGDYVFAVGYSEPDVGSDVSAVKTRAERIPDGWRVSGTKMWTSAAHQADFIFVLCRTSPSEGDRHQGLTTLIVQLPAKGLTVQPILLPTGEHGFNEVILDGVEVPDSMVLGQPGEAWKIITSELVLERCGPERFMSTFPLLVELVRRTQSNPDNERALVGIGELVARFWALRTMSIAIAAALEDGQSLGVEAALVKDMGTRFESEITEYARLLYSVIPSFDSEDLFVNFLAQSVMQSPAFTLRGGTNEVLRGIIARGLGLR
ncbi:MAG: acyl-CoA dehydrogenase family protein [Sterolibacterium sp.]